jgi:hypothetical protein
VLAFRFGQYGYEISTEWESLGILPFWLVLVWYVLKARDCEDAGSTFGSFGWFCAAVGGLELEPREDGIETLRVGLCQGSEKFSREQL